MATQIENLAADPIYVTDALISEDIDAYLAQHEHKRNCCASSPAATSMTARAP